VTFHLNGVAARSPNGARSDAESLPGNAAKQFAVEQVMLQTSPNTEPSDG